MTPVEAREPRGRISSLTSRSSSASLAVGASGSGRPGTPPQVPHTAARTPVLKSVGRSVGTVLALAVGSLATATVILLMSPAADPPWSDARRAHVLAGDTIAVHSAALALLILRRSPPAIKAADRAARESPARLLVGGVVGLVMILTSVCLGFFSILAWLGANNW